MRLAKVLLINKAEQLVNLPQFGLSAVEFLLINTVDFI